MPQGNNRIPDQVATGARRFLRLAIVFFLGFLAAHTDTVHRIENAGPSEVIDSLISNTHDSFDKELTVWSGVPNALNGGAVLLGPEYARDLALVLVNEQGHFLHRWTIENGRFNDALNEWWKNLRPGLESAIDDAQLLPNGDVVFIQVQMSINNYRGERLARMDRDSHILWQVPGNFHHRIDIAGNPQKIYALTSQLRAGFPEVAPPRDNIRFLEDCVAAYSMDGKKLGQWSLVDAFEHSPYRDWLSSFDMNIPLVQRIIQPDGRVLYDLFHLNSVQYLGATQAKALPRAREGDLLVSFRTMNALAVFRPSTQQIVWAVKGPWRHQHNARVGDDGKLYIFDNEGRQAVTFFVRLGPPEQFISRLIRFDPFNNQTSEIYASTELYTYFLGDYQPLPDNSWIISSPLHGSVIVVNADKKITWQLLTVPGRQDYVPHRKQISFMRYYPASMVKSFAGGKDANEP